MSKPPINKKQRDRKRKGMEVRYDLQVLTAFNQILFLKFYQLTSLPVDPAAD